MGSSQCCTAVSAMSVVWFTGSAVAGRGNAAGRARGTSEAEEMESQASLPLLPVTCDCHCHWKYGVVCATSPATTKLSEAAGSAAAAGNSGL